MSNFYLCDMCAAPHWLTEDGLFVCERNPFAVEPKVMVDYGSPFGYLPAKKVCKSYESEEHSEN